MCEIVIVNRKVLQHAVVRHDPCREDIADAITFVAVVPSKDEAVREVERLNRLAASKSSRYFWTPAKCCPDGRGVSDD